MIHDGKPLLRGCHSGPGLVQVRSGSGGLVPVGLVRVGPVPVGPVPVGPVPVGLVPVGPVLVGLVLGNKTIFLRCNFIINHHLRYSMPSALIY